MPSQAGREQYRKQDSIENDQWCESNEEIVVSLLELVKRRCVKRSELRCDPVGHSIPEPTIYKVMHEFVGHSNTTDSANQCNGNLTRLHSNRDTRGGLLDLDQGSESRPLGVPQNKSESDCCNREDDHNKTK